MVAGALALLFGATLAVKLVMIAVLIAIPYGLRALLREIGSDPRYAYFAISLTYSAHLVLGFLNFLAAVPFMLFSLVYAARYRAAPTLVRSLTLAGLLLTLFYMHVLPFALAMVGVGLVLLGCRGRYRLGAVGALAPALAAAALWTQGSDAGGSTVDLLKATLQRETNDETRFQPLEKTIRELPDWLTDVLPGVADVCLLAAACMILIGVALALREQSGAPPVPRSTRLLVLLPPLALALAFTMPYQHAWIWPVAGRFPYLFLLLLPIVLPRMRLAAGMPAAALLAALGLAHVALVGVAFYRSDRKEARGFEGALATIPVGAHTLGLMYGAGSRFVRYGVFMQYHAYVQAERGGVTAFSFASLPQSPFVYRGYPAGPPPVNLGSGWAPQNADMQLAARFFEYAIAHGENPHLQLVHLFYEPVYSRNGWSVFRRR